MIRLLFLFHRYLGIALGFLLLLWCLSGVVMMYVHYPEMDNGERLRTLVPLDLQECCILPGASVLAQFSMDAVVVEMLDQATPVLRFQESGFTLMTWDLRRGVPLRGIEMQTANGIADGAARASGLMLEETPPEIVVSDQWTVSGSYNSHRPFYLFNTLDKSRTELYVSSRTGEVVLVTTGSERFWNYFGAVVHWVYPTVLRQHPILWSQVVIWLSLAGVFLTLTGLYVGVRQLRHRPEGRSSPYAGITLWHHYTGLFSGVIALLWVGSGFLSMNPWGLLEGEGSATEVRALQGRGLDPSDVFGALRRLPDFPFQPGTVRLELYNTAGSLVIATSSADGAGARFDAATYLPSPLSEDDLRQLALTMLPEVSTVQTTMLETGDAYYYEHHATPEFPVFRAIADDDEQRRYYLDPVTGQLLAKVDNEAKLYRWLFAGMHRADFIPILRERPLWDVVVLLMLAVVTALCGTGTYLGFRHLKS